MIYLKRNMSPSWTNSSHQSGGQMIICSSSIAAPCSARTHGCVGLLNVIPEAFNSIWRRGLGVIGLAFLSRHKISFLEVPLSHLVDIPSQAMGWSTRPPLQCCMMKTPFLILFLVSVIVPCTLAAGTRSTATFQTPWFLQKLWPLLSLLSSRFIVLWTC
jgi:hypothetical protein